MYQFSNQLSEFNTTDNILISEVTLNNIINLPALNAQIDYFLSSLNYFFYQEV